MPTDFIPYVEGDTEQIPMQLLDGSAPPEAPLTGTVLLSVRNCRGTVIPTTGKTAIIDPDTWEVGYSPAAGDLRATGGEHRLHWTVQQGGVEFSFPRGPGIELQVSER